MAMSDNQNAPQQGQSGAPPIAIHAQYIKDLSFDNPLSPGRLMPRNNPPQIDLYVTLKMRQLEGRTFEVALVMGADARNTETNDALFIMELVYCAVVTLGEVPQEAVGPLLLIETPRLLFPFARGILANVSREAGFPPLQVAPVDFVALYRQQQEQAQQTMPNVGVDAPVN